MISAPSYTQQNLYIEIHIYLYIYIYINSYSLASVHQRVQFWYNCTKFLAIVKRVLPLSASIQMQNSRAIHLGYKYFVQKRSFTAACRVNEPLETRSNWLKTN